jgi:hypothetical protein
MCPLVQAQAADLAQVTTRIEASNQCPYQQEAEAPPADIRTPSPDDRPKSRKRQPPFGCEDVREDLSRIGAQLLCMQQSELQHAIPNVATRCEEKTDRGGDGARSFEQIPATGIPGKESAHDGRRNGEQHGREAACPIRRQPYVSRFQIVRFAGAGGHVRKRTDHSEGAAGVGLARDRLRSWARFPSPWARPAGDHCVDVAFGDESRDATGRNRGTTSACESRNFTISTCCRCREHAPGNGRRRACSGTFSHGADGWTPRSAEQRTNGCRTFPDSKCMRDGALQKPGAGAGFVGLGAGRRAFVEKRRQRRPPHGSRLGMVRD